MIIFAGMKSKRNVIVTGASRGIGYAIVRSFLELGDCTVVAIARSGQGLERLQQECKDLPGTLHTLSYDIAAEGAAGELFAIVAKLIPTVDILINNAGLLVFKDFEDISAEELDEMYRINLRAPFLLIQALLPALGDGSHIVNISSMGGVQGSVKFQGLSAYSATKGALSILTETLAAELADRGIRVNCLAPGAVQTEMLAQAFPAYKAPLDPPEMGEFIRDFAMKGGSFFNGKILPVSVSTP